MFFEELTISLIYLTLLKYENLLIMGDFNIDVKSKSLAYNKLDEFCDLFNLTNCLTKNYNSLTNLFLTNPPFFNKNRFK